MDCDVTDKIAALVEQGVESITVFVTAKTDKNNSLQLYAQEQGDGSLATRITASYTAKAPSTTTETLEVKDGDYDLYYQTRDGASGTTDYRLLVVANEDYIKTLASAEITATFTNGSTTKTLNVSITKAFSTVEAVDEDGNITVYNTNDGTVIMGVVVKGVPAGYSLVEDSAEFKAVAAN